MAPKQRTTSGTTPPSTFDIRTRTMAEFVTVEIMDPLFPGQKVDTGARIRIYSPRSRAARRAARASAAQIKMEDEKIVSSEDEVADNVVDQTIGATFWWNLTDGGKPIECTPENVRAVYTSPATSWIQAQVQKKFLDTAGFFVAAKPA